MRKKPRDIAKLLEKFKKGACIPEELVFIQAWLASPENEKEAAEIIGEDFQQFSSSAHIKEGDAIKSRIWQSVEREVSRQHPLSTPREVSKSVPFRKTPSKRLLRIAAVIVFPLLAFAGVIGYYMHVEGIFAVDDPAIAAKMYESRTTAGQKKNIRLADGSTVRINSGSLIRFNEDFLSHPIRELYLEGEAFFDVVPNGKPFVIKTSRSEVRVLGTSFNVKDFNTNHQLKVAVSSGEVSVNIPGQEQLLVKPGKIAIYSQPENQAMVKKIEDMEAEFGWKDNILLFKNASFEEILERLANWYGVTFRVDPDFHPSRRNFSARYQNESLKTVMEGISHAGGFSYRIDQNQVWIGNRGNP